jgi:ComF family protein
VPYARSRRRKADFANQRATPGELLRGIVELVLPGSCAGCRVPFGFALVRQPAPLCDRCTLALPRIDRSGAATCSSCDEPLADLTAPGRDLRCAECEDRASPLATCQAGFWFEGEVARWIHAFKYPPGGLLNFDPSARNVIRALAHSAARRYRGARPRVVPIPLHSRRLRERGFNPAVVIAREMARELSAPLLARSLVRVRDTPSQTGLGRRERRRNVAGAFRCRLEPSGQAPVLLVDDVITTGSTLEEAARILLRAGAPSVSALCIGRAADSAGSRR